MIPKMYKFAIVSDMDGVLINSRKAIPGQETAVQNIQGNEIPFVLLTNNGICTE